MTISQALREAANLLESGEVPFDWTQAHSCNCGVLGFICQNRRCRNDSWLIRDYKYQVSLETKSCIWTSGSHEHSFKCSLTLLPMNSVFRSLREVGFTWEDMGDIEFLNNDEVRERAGLSLSLITIYIDNFLEAREDSENRKDYENKYYVIKYFRAMADIREELESSSPITDVAYQPSMKPLETIVA